MRWTIRSSQNEALEFSVARPRVSRSQRRWNRIEIPEAEVNKNCKLPYIALVKRCSCNSSHVLGRKSLPFTQKSHLCPWPLHLDRWKSVDPVLLRRSRWFASPDLGDPMGIPCVKVSSGSFFMSSPGCSLRWTAPLHLGNWRNWQNWQNWLQFCGFGQSKCRKWIELVSTSPAFHQTQPPACFSKRAKCLPQRKSWRNNRCWHSKLALNKECTVTHMEVSENGGTPKSSILTGFSIIDYRPCILGIPYLWKPPYDKRDKPKTSANCRKTPWPWRNWHLACLPKEHQAHVKHLPQSRTNKNTAFFALESCVNFDHHKSQLSPLSQW